MSTLVAAAANPADISQVSITDAEFARFRQLIYQMAGIRLSETKHSLVSGRLTKRLRHYGMATFSDYLKLVTASNENGELQVMVDLLTTNETYFFREQAHFDFLSDTILPAIPSSAALEIWSAACSSGEEVYTLCMLLAKQRGMNSQWRVTGTDISTQVLATARTGQYSLARTRGLPEAYLKQWCLKGVRSAAGMFQIAPELLARTRFMQLNLNTTLPDIGRFDVIFLRNVMIYFDLETKRQVVERVVSKLRPGGYLIVGHSESLNGFAGRLRLVRPTIYQLPE